VISTPVGVYARIRAVAEILAGRPITDDITPVLNDQAELVMSQGGASYQEIVRSGGAVKIGTTAAIDGVVAVATQAQILALVGAVRETAPTDAALALVKLNGNGNASLNIRSILNATALPATTGLAANWFPWGSQMLKTGAAATPGYGGQAMVNGGIIVPPGRYFAMHVLSSVVGETFVAFAGVHMKQLNLG